MLVKTRFFGEVDLPEEKILTFEHGLIGLGEYKKFTILYDCDKEDSNISWLQSVEEPSFALQNSLQRAKKKLTTDTITLQD